MAGGREHELEQIKRANRTAAVGRLLMGEVNSWNEFIEAGQISPDLPRRNIKAGARDVRRNVSKRIKSWVGQNFIDANLDQLVELYDEIMAHRGLEMPLREFESHFFRIKPEVLCGTPPHGTVVISLWGLKFMFPEDFLSKDVITALGLATKAHQELQTFRRSSQNHLTQNRETISKLIREKEYAQRSCLHACYSLLEAYLNGLAWAAIEGALKISPQEEERADLEGCAQKSLRWRLFKVPTILTGRVLWEEKDELVTGILDTMKPFRDSLTHPSPFRAPEKFGGYDKLANFYRVDFDTAFGITCLISVAVSEIHGHVHGADVPEPPWLTDLEKAVEEASKSFTETTSL